MDRLDDSWDASEASKNLIIGLLKASNEINSRMNGKVVITTFLRSDIYDFLFFDDQDKLRQNEEIIRWTGNELREVICERVKVSIGLDESNDYIWQQLFSPKLYRSKATAEKYLVERTFKRPRDMISFVRLAIETAINNDHSQIESRDTRLSEESGYSQSKYKDLIIEYQRQMPFIKDLLDSFSGTTHALSMAEIDRHLKSFIDSRGLPDNSQQVLRSLFQIGFVGIKRRGRAGVRQRGGTQFYYYYDDPSINPLSYSDFYIHPSLRYHLNIKERKMKATGKTIKRKKGRAKRK